MNNAIEFKVPLDNDESFFVVCLAKDNDVILKRIIDKYNNIIIPDAYMLEKSREKINHLKMNMNIGLTAYATN